MHLPPNRYDECAEAYHAWVRASEQAGIEANALMQHMLEVIGDVRDKQVLDAGCGTGLLARALTARGARVTAIDIAPRLVAFGRAQDPAGTIDYQVADLSQPLPAYSARFDLVASYFVLNDVPDYRGFLASLAAMLKPGGRTVMLMNNPYSFVVRNHLRDYFSHEAVIYPGLAEQGIRVYFYQRTLAEYLDAFLSAGLRLERLVDVPTPATMRQRPANKLIPDDYQFPYVMILAFERPGAQ